MRESKYIIRIFFYFFLKKHYISIIGIELCVFVSVFVAKNSETHESLGLFRSSSSIKEE